MSVGARRVRALSDYPFVALERRAAAIRSGRPVLRFAIGDPDLPPSPELLKELRRALKGADVHRYSSTRGEPELRESFAEWFWRRFGVALDPEREVAVLSGTKEGIAALPRALVDPGDRVGVPDPGYPAYPTAVELAGARPIPVPLAKDHRWVPTLDDLPDRLRLLYLNYPNNPTGALAAVADLRPIVERARRTSTTLAYDNAYSELTYDGVRAPSILEVPGAREVALEFHSLSKTLGIPGWRLGFAVGSSERLAALVRLKSHADSGAARPLQIAAAALVRRAAGTGWPRSVTGAIASYGRRLRTLFEGLRELGFEVDRPRATLYLWQRAPDGDGTAFADELLRTHRILVTPGAAFGPRGAPYVRWSITAPDAAIREALERLGRRPNPTRPHVRAPRSGAMSGRAGRA